MLETGKIAFSAVQTDETLLGVVASVCSSLRTDGIKAMPRGFSGSKRVLKVANSRNRSRVCLF